jgi:hypothetical protein
LIGRTSKSPQDQGKQTWKKKHVAPADVSMLMAFRERHILAILPWLQAVNILEHQNKFEFCWKKILFCGNLITLGLLIHLSRTRFYFKGYFITCEVFSPDLLADTSALTSRLIERTHFCRIQGQTQTWKKYRSPPIRVSDLCKNRSQERTVLTCFSFATIESV